MTVQAMISAVNGQSLPDAIFDAVTRGTPKKTAERAPSWLGALRERGASMAKGIARSLFNNTVKTLDTFKNIVARIVSDYLQRKDIDVNVTAERITMEDNSLKIVFSLSEINYISIADTVLPFLLSKVNTENETGLLPQLVDVIGEDKEKMIHGVLELLPDEKKEQIVGVLVNHYNRAICEKLSALLAEKGIGAQVNDLSVV